MDVLELLKQDHRKVADLFQQIEATEVVKKHQQLFQRVKAELEAHMHIEETILYPSFEKHEELKDITLEAYEEHKQVKTLIREIAALSEGSERFDAKLKVLGENVEHHVEEEETEMFSKAKQHYDSAQLEQLGLEMQAAKTEFAKKSRAKTSSSK